MKRCQGNLPCGRLTNSSPEFQSTYGSTSDEEFVTLLYQNVLDRTPSEVEIEYWTGRIDGGMDRSKVVFFFVDSPEFRTQTEPGFQAFVQAYGPDDVIDPGPGDAVVSGGLWVDTFDFTDDMLASEVIVTDVEAWDRLDFSSFGPPRNRFWPQWRRWKLADTCHVPQS